MGIPPENLNNKHTNMKKIMIFSAIFAVAISLSACSNNETDISYASAETITLSSTTLNFEKEGGTQTAEVESTHEFAAYSNDSWIKVTPTNPVGKKATITVTVGENLGAERTGNVTIWSGGSRQNITVTQAKGGQNITCPIEGYNLVWNDEFSDNELGPDWTYEIKPAGWVNNELQTYVREDKVAQVSNGTLKINLLDDGGTIKSARLYARESTGWKYGYIEASIKLPKGKGTWPAFWMMPVNWQQWPGDGEIDIMESVGYDPDVVVSTIHCTKYNNSGTTIESARRKISNSQNGVDSRIHDLLCGWRETPHLSQRRQRQGGMAFRCSLLPHPQPRLGRYLGRRPGRRPILLTCHHGGGLRSRIPEVIFPCISLRS